MIESRKSEIIISTSTDCRDILPNALVVVTTIGVGGRRAWEQDVFIPRKYGIYQPVGGYGYAWWNLPGAANDPTSGKDHE